MRYKVPRVVLTSSMSTQQVDLVIKFLGSYVGSGFNLGRDKIHRFLQYFSRFLIAYHTKRNAPKEVVAKWNSLMQVCAQTRKSY